MRARAAWASLTALVLLLLAADPAQALAGQAVPPSGVPSVSVTNPAPDLLTASWQEPTTAGSLSGYVVRVRGVDGTVATQRSTSALTESFAVLAGGYYVTVAPVGAEGEGVETASPTLLVSSLVRTGTTSAGVVRPFRDGFQDAVTVRATSNFAASGAVHVLSPSGRVVRTFPLATGTSWSARFDGRTSWGAALPLGAYRLQFVLGGAVYATRSVLVAGSQVAAPSRRWSLRTFFPAADGFRDSARLAVTTNVPATMSVVITGTRGKARQKVFGRGWLSRRTSGVFTWNGRYHGKVAPAGTYRATVRVRGGEGVARSASTRITVSSKRRVARSFQFEVTARTALDRMGLGRFSAGSDAGGQRLWGCSAPGCDPDAGLYSAVLPASVAPYAGVTVSACVRTTGGKPAGRLSYTSAQGGLIGPMYGFASGGAGCYRPGISPGTAVSGRTLHWMAGNLDPASRSSIDVAYFRVSGRRFVLR